MSNENTVASAEDQVIPNKVYRFSATESELSWDTAECSEYHWFPALSEGIPPTIQAYPQIFKRTLISEAPISCGPEEAIARSCEIQICKHALPPELQKTPLIPDTLESFGPGFSPGDGRHQRLDKALRNYLSQYGLNPGHSPPPVEQNKPQPLSLLTRTMIWGIVLTIGGISGVVLCISLGGFFLPLSTVAILCSIFILPLGTGVYIVAQVASAQITAIRKKNTAEKKLRRLVEQAKSPEHKIPEYCPEKSPKKHEATPDSPASTLVHPDAITSTTDTHTTAIQQEIVSPKSPDPTSQSVVESEQNGYADSKDMETPRYSSDLDPYGIVHQDPSVTQPCIAKASTADDAAPTTLSSELAQQVMPEQTTPGQQAEPCYELSPLTVPTVLNNCHILFKSPDEPILQPPLDPPLPNTIFTKNYYCLFFPEERMDAVPAHVLAPSSLGP